jgi:hypothetical protein
MDGVVVVVVVVILGEDGVEEWEGVGQHKSAGSTILPEVVGMERRARSYMQVRHNLSSPVLLSFLC